MGEVWRGALALAESQRQGVPDHRPDPGSDEGAVEPLVVLEVREDRADEDAGDESDELVLGHR